MTQTQGSMQHAFDHYGGTDTRHHHQYDPMPQPWTQTDALLSELLRVLHGLRADVEQVNITLLKMRGEAQARQEVDYRRMVASGEWPFPETSLRHGTPR